jgi:hypothetical protein
MNIFPKDMQYFITELFFENNQEIIKLYTDYSPEKIFQEKIEINKFLFRNAASCGNIRLMIFLLDNKFPWNSNTFECAAIHGNLENMQWLLEKGCPWSYNTFVGAALHGDLENMKWLFYNECPWSSWVF